VGTYLRLPGAIEMGRFGRLEDPAITGRKYASHAAVIALDVDFRTAGFETLP
jgi:hypothetical protein